MQLADWHTFWKQKGAAHVRALLMEQWDPIGVAGIPEAADEYDSYVGHVGRMLREGKGAQEIADYLRQVRTVRMGLGGGQVRSEAEVAALLVAWYEDVLRGS